MRVHFHGAAGEVTGSLHEVEAAGRGSFRVGVGGEWRFARRWALEAQLRAHGVGENTKVAPVSPETLNYQMTRYGLTGGAIMLGVSVYL